MEIIFAIIQWAMIIVVAFLPIALDVDAVRRLRRSSAADSTSPWRHRAAYVGVGSNIFVFGLPITLLVHNIIVNSPWDSDPIYSAMAVLVALSIVLAVVGPKYVRPQLTIGALLPLLFWSTLPGAFSEPVSAAQRLNG